MVPAAGWLGGEIRDPRPAVLLMATVLAAVLRIYSLGDHPLWIDEYLTWKFLRPAGDGASLWTQLRDSFQSPLTIALLWPLSRGACSEFWLRLPGALAGIATVPLGALLAARLAGRRTGEWAALLLAVQPFMIWHSQEARGYALTMLLITGASLLLVRMIRRGPDTATAVGYGLTAGLAVLANNSALFMVVAHGLSVLVLARPRRTADWGRWALAFSLAVVVTAPWLLKASGILAVERLAPGVAMGEALRQDSTFTPWALPFAAHSIVYGYTLGPSLTELHGADRLDVVVSWLPLLAPAGLLAVLLVFGGLWRMPRRSGIAVSIWILIPLCAVVLLSMRNVKAFNVRYLAAIVPVVVMLASRGIVHLRYGRWLGLAMLGLVLASLGGYYGSERYAREDLRTVARIIEERAGPNDVVLVPVVGDLYAHYQQTDMRVEPFWGCPRIHERQQALTALNERIDGADRAWLVLCRAWDLDPRDLLPGALSELGQVDERFGAAGVRVFSWRPSSAPSGESAEPIMDTETRP